MISRGNENRVLVRINYSKDTVDKILKYIIILVDTREQKIQHILDWFDEKEIKYRIETLPYCDYALAITPNDILKNQNELYLNHLFTIERKASLEELSGNFTKGRKRIEAEFERAKGKIFLMIENAIFDDIINHNYKTKFKPNSYIATLKTFEARYGISTNFVQDEDKVGEFIYKTLIYQAREYLLK